MVVSILVTTQSLDDCVSYPLLLTGGTTQFTLGSKIDRLEI
jgi:hypothetical protein